MTKLSTEEELTKRAYDKYAEVWSKKYGDDNFWINEYKKFNQLLPKGKIIDIGSGAGRDMKALYQLGYDCVGADISEPLLKIARQRVPKAKFINQSVYNLSFDHKFDGFWCTATLLHVPKNRINEALSAIKSILKSNAVGFITIKDGQGNEIEDFEIEKGVVLKRFYQYWSQKDFQTTLEKNGFKILSYTYRPVTGRQKWHCFFVKLS